MNCISFNGIVISDLISVGNGYLGFNIKGQNEEEFPIIIIKEKMRNGINKGDKIGAVGRLIKINDEWCIDIVQATKILTEEEIDDIIKE